MEYSSNIDYWLNKPSEEELAAQRARVRVDFTRLDLSDPDALEKWKYPSGRPNSLEIGERALYLAETTVSEAA